MIARAPKFKTGDWVQARGYDHTFQITERRTIKAKSGYPKYEYREIWTWWPQKDLKAVRTVGGDGEDTMSVREALIVRRGRFTFYLMECTGCSDTWYYEPKRKRCHLCGCKLERVR
jgi:hypothetical protein